MPQGLRPTVTGILQRLVNPNVPAKTELVYTSVAYNYTYSHLFHF